MSRIVGPFKFIGGHYVCTDHSLDCGYDIKTVDCGKVISADIVTAYELERPNNPTQAKVVKILQGYSKEVEHSYENGELLEDEFIFNPFFSTDNLIGIL